MTEFGLPPTQEEWNVLKNATKERIIWGANNFALEPYQGFVVWKKKTISETFTMSMCEIASITPGLGTIAKLYECQPQDPERFHPTQKPVSLYKFLMTHYTKNVKTILDPFGGSMSSGIAALDAGIDIDIIEINTTYFKLGVERLQKYVNQQQLF